MPSNDMKDIVRAFEATPEFRSNFNKILRFANGLHQAQIEQPATWPRDIESVNCINNEITTWFKSFLNRFVNAYNNHDLVWEDSFKFIKAIGLCPSKEAYDLLIFEFVTKLIKEVNDSRVLTNTQKDLLQDQFFATANLEQKFLQPVGLTLAAITTTILFGAALYNGIILFEVLAACLEVLIGVIIAKACLDDNSDSAPRNFIHWTKNVADEIQRLGFPCEPDHNMVARDLGIPVARQITAANPSLALSANKEQHALASFVQLWFRVFDHSANALLRDGETRRRLDAINMFMLSKVGVRYAENAVSFYLRIRAEPEDMHTALNGIVTDYRDRIEASRGRLTEHEKEAMLQPCLARTCKISDSPLTFRLWAYEVDKRRQLIDIPLGQAVVAEPIEELEIGLERGKPNGRCGYSPVSRVEV